jgi:hypothetical protein
MQAGRAGIRGSRFNQAPDSTAFHPGYTAIQARWS